jgi:hypothetical protein
MFLAYLIDGGVQGNSWLKRADSLLMRCAPAVPLFVRIAVGVFFLVLWIFGDTILTPELKTTRAWVSWLQLAIAVSTLWSPALIFTAAGITTLYLYGVAMYGAFHMMDYPIFLGIAVYLGLGAFKATAHSRLRLSALYFNLALTMMWGAIEKFAYPYWTFPLLTDHRAMTLGIPFDKFMIIAGFVEFSLAFFMLTGTVLMRLSCLALLTIMAVAIPEFGKTDALGHFLIMATLAVMIAMGRQGIKPPPGLPGSDGILVRSSLQTVAYGTTLLGLFGLYYAAQFVAGR